MSALTKAEKRALSWLKYFPDGLPARSCGQTMPTLAGRGYVIKACRRDHLGYRKDVWLLTDAGKRASPARLDEGD